jgi:hypothetical protein
MNEARNKVNLKYIDFVISKKKKIIDFLDELELFIGEKQVFTKKQIRHSVFREFMAVQMRILSARFLKDTSPFGSLKEVGLTSSTKSKK